MRKLITISLLFVGASVMAQTEADSPEHRPSHGGIFEKMDADGDGKISKEEHEAAIAKQLEHHRKMFSKLDANGDGYIDKQEAEKGRERMHEKFRENREERRENRAAE